MGDRLASQQPLTRFASRRGYLSSDVTRLVRLPAIRAMRTSLDADLRVDARNSLLIADVLLPPRRLND